MKKYISLLLIMVSIFTFAQEDINGDVKVEEKKEKKKVVPEVTASIIVSEGKAMYANGEFFQALQKFKKALAKDADHYGANLGAAQVYYIWMNYKVSERHISKALKNTDAPTGDGLF